MQGVYKGVQEAERKKSRLLAFVLAGLLCLSACGRGDLEAGKQITGENENKGKAKEENVEIQIFIAASLDNVMTELARIFQKDHPNVTITYNAGSSGALMTQIKEGFSCDIFFSASPKQMDQLEAEGFVEENSRRNIVNNQVAVVTRKDSGTKVRGLSSLKDATSIALAGESVPVGRYTRQALLNQGILTGEDPSAITTKQVSKALGGVVISEQDNVSKVLLAVLEGSCEVGTTYCSDIYGYEEELKILELVDAELTGEVLYPAARIKNKEAGENQREAAKQFLDFLLSQEAKEVFESYYFDTDVE